MNIVCNDDVVRCEECRDAMPENADKLAMGTSMEPCAICDREGNCDA